MKKCPKCNLQHEDDSQFCNNCGTYLGESSFSVSFFDFWGKLGKLTQSHSFANTFSLNDCTQEKGEKYGQPFISQDKMVQATIGVSYVQSYMSGEGFKRGAAVLTDKRLYYFGQLFTGKGTTVTGFTEDGIVSAEDITFTRFIHRNPVGCLVIGLFIFIYSILSLIIGIADEATGILLTGLVALFVSIIFFLYYYISRSTILEIAFPGGSFMIDSKWYSKASMRDFQHQIHLVKDNLKTGRNIEADERTEVS